MLAHRRRSLRDPAEFPLIDDSGNRASQCRKESAKECQDRSDPSRRIMPHPQNQMAETGKCRERKEANADPVQALFNPMASAGRMDMKANLPVEKDAQMR